MKVLIEVAIKNWSLCSKGSMKHVGHLYFSSMKAVTNMRSSWIKSEPTFIKLIPGHCFVIDNGLTAINMTRYLILNSKLQVTYRGKHGGPTGFPRDFWLGSYVLIIILIGSYVLISCIRDQLCAIAVEAVLGMRYTLFSRIIFVI